MNITVEYWAQVRLAAGTAMEVVTVAKAANLSSILHLLADRHGEPFRKMVFDDAGRPRCSNMFAQGPDILRTDETSLLADGSVLTIASPIGGG